MCAETLAVEDMKKDIEELIKVSIEEGDEFMPVKNLYFMVQRERDHVSFLKDRYEHKLAVSEITGENLTSRRFANTVLSLLQKYERKQLLILLDSAVRLLNLRRSEGSIIDSFVSSK
jgi:hypothetical protein